MSKDPIDPGVLLEVPPDQRMDTDDPDSTHASTGGTADEDLDEVRDPDGRVVPEAELQDE